MLIPNSRPVSPQPAAFAAADGSRAPPPQTTAVPSRSIAAQFAVQLQHQAADAVVGDQQVRARARPPRPRRPPPPPSASSSTSCSSSARAGRRGRPGRRPGPWSAARAGSRARRPAGGRAHRVLRPRPAPRPSLKMSPAPIVTSRSPRASRGRERPRGAIRVHAATRPAGPPARSAAARATSSPLTPASGADRLLARGIDVEHRDLVGGGERRAEPPRERLGARVEVGLEDGDQAARARAREAPRGRPPPRSGGGRSRRRSRPRRGGP